MIITPGSWLQGKFIVFNGGNPTAFKNRFPPSGLRRFVFNHPRVNTPKVLR